MAITETINALIIDDEQNNIDNLKALLSKHCKQVSILATATNAVDAEVIIVQYQPDVIFLDIQMPNKNAFDLLASFSKANFEVIFVTAHDKYGIQAIKFSAIDYLLKPIDIEELMVAVDKVVAKKSMKQYGKIENLLSIINHQQQKDEHRIALASASEINYVKTSEIIRCQSSNNYTTFYFANGSKQIVSKSIADFEDMLRAYDFIRCHQSHLINKKYIKSLIKKDGGYFVMDDATKIPISKQKKEMVKSFLE